MSIGPYTDLERTIVINGKKEIAPEEIVNIEAYKEFRVHQEKLRVSELSSYTFESGLKINLPNPRLKIVCNENGIPEEEFLKAKAQAAQLYSMTGKMSYMKRLAFGIQAGAVAKLEKKKRERKKKEKARTQEKLILDLFGKWMNPLQVHKHLLEKGFEVPYSYVRLFFNQNKEKIRELRNKDSEDYNDLPIGQKRSRLEILDTMLSEFRMMFDRDTDPNKLNISREIRSLLEQARKEVEGDELKLTVNGSIDINATIQVAMNNSNQLQQLTILQMVMARVCARTGISYNRMVDALANSFYCRFNGLRVNTNLEEKPIYPSELSYDIFDLEQKSLEYYKKEKEDQIEDAVIIEEEKGKESRGELIKEQLLSILQKKNAMLKKVDKLKI